MKTRLVMQSISAILLAATSLYAQFSGKLLVAEYGWHGDTPTGLFLVDGESGTYETITTDQVHYAEFSSDGMEICGTDWGGMFIMNNDGTNRRTLFTNAQLEAATGFASVSTGWRRMVVFQENGIYWIQTGATYPHTPKKILFADRFTGAIQEILDISQYGDAVQQISASRDGLKFVTWLHQEVLAITFESLHSNPTVRSMNFNGHGPLITADGTALIIGGTRHDMAPGSPFSKTFIVYDYNTATSGRSIYQHVFPQFITIYGNHQVRNSDDHIAFTSEAAHDAGPNTGWHILNWRTGECMSVPSPWTGGDFHGDLRGAWRGELPDPNAPSIKLERFALNFNSLNDFSSQLIEITNNGTGTLNNVSVAIEPVAAAQWLSVQRSGSGNEQRLETIVATDAVSDGVYRATVTVGAENSRYSPVYTVTLSVGDDPTGVTVSSNTATPASSEYRVRISSDNVPFVSGPENTSIVLELFSLRGERLAIFTGITNRELSAAASLPAKRFAYRNSLARVTATRDRTKNNKHYHFVR